MPRRKANPHELGYRFYRGYIWRRSLEMPSGGPVTLWNPAGSFICLLSIRDLPRYVDKSIKFGWEDKFMPPSRSFEQLQLI